MNDKILCRECKDKEATPGLNGLCSSCLTKLENEEYEGAGIKDPLTINDNSQIRENHGKPWIKEDEIYLCELIEQGKDWEEIGILLMRTAIACEKHYMYLVKKLGDDTVNKQEQEPITMEDLIISGNNRLEDVISYHFQEIHKQIVELQLITGYKFILSIEHDNEGQ